jgi:hypothetical protein
VVAAIFWTDVCEVGKWVGRSSVVVMSGSGERRGATLMLAAVAGAPKGRSRKEITRYGGAGLVYNG